MFKFGKKENRKPGRSVFFDDEENGGSVAVSESGEITSTNTEAQLKLLLQALKAVKSGEKPQNRSANIS